MRYLIYLLIIANLAFFAWYPRPQVPKDPYPVHAPPVHPDVETLVLLSERQLADEYHRRLADASPETTNAAARREPKIADTAQRTDEAAAPTPPQPAPPPEPEPAVQPEPPPAEPVAVCHTIGPFNAEADAKAAARRLARWGLEPKQRTSDVQEQNGYWVYLPSMPAAEAKAVARTLDEQGFSDYFIGRQNYISLGLFSDKTTANRRRAQVERMGLEPRVGPRFKNRTAYWLDVEESSDKLLSDDRWSELETEQPEAQRQPVACE
jgi:hypothetical protein